MSGICDTCQRNHVCRRPMDGMDSCRLYVSGKKSNYEKLFGTPKRAARTSWYMLMCKHMDCDKCPIADGCDITTDIDCDDGEAALLEWLRGDAE